MKNGTLTNHGGHARLCNAYNECLQIARSHYENFPVASRFVPGKFRYPIAVIYAFARTADDFADEGNLDPVTRLQKLDDYRDRLLRLDTDHGGENPIFIALDDVITKHDLPLTLFLDLLTAFSMDVNKQRYSEFPEILDYCRYSANPVGHLLLHLYDKATEQNLKYSDEICTALQLINFLQDIQQDLRESNRIYLPQDEMSHYEISEQDILDQGNKETMKQLIDHQLVRIMDMLQKGMPLGRVLPGRIGFELRMTIAGATCIVEKLMRNTDPYARPRLAKLDWLRMAWQSLRKSD